MQPASFGTAPLGSGAPQLPKAGPAKSSPWEGFDPTPGFNLGVSHGGGVIGDILNAGGGGNPAPYQANVGGSAPPASNSTPSPSQSNTSGGGYSNGYTGGYGGSSGSYGSTAPIAPAPTPSPLTGAFNDALNKVIGYYNQIFGNENAATGSAEANIRQGYNSQIGNLNNSYAQAQAQVPWQLVGRGAGSSSWADNANTFANNAFNNSLSGIQSGESNDLANLQRQQDTAEGEGKYFINQEAPSLRTLFPNLDAYYQNAQIAQLLGQGQQLAGQLGGEKTIGALESQMKQNPSYTQGGSAAINNLISQLSGSGAPAAIQNQILTGLIGNPNNTPVNKDTLTNLRPPQAVGT